MRKNFTLTSLCHSEQSKEPVCCTPTTANDIKNNTKDDLANAGSFSFIKGFRHCEEAPRSNLIINETTYYTQHITHNTQHITH